MKTGLLITSLQSFLEFAQCLQPVAFEFPDPALGDVVDRHRVEVVQLLSALLHGGDQIGLLQNPQMLADRLPRHVEARAEFVQGLAVVRTQPVEQFPAAGIGQGFEHLIHSHNMQPFGCLSRMKLTAGARHPMSALGQKRTVELSASSRANSFDRNVRFTPQAYRAAAMQMTVSARSPAAMRWPSAIRVCDRASFPPALASRRKAGPHNAPCAPAARTAASAPSAMICSIVPKPDGCRRCHSTPPVMTATTAAPICGRNN